MRILIFGINYAPELTGIGKYTAEMAEWLAGQGHDVHVLTAMPYYPEWNVHQKYKGKLWFKEIINGVVIHRCPLYVPKEVSSLKRIIHEFSFWASSLPFWIKSIFGKKYDLVFCIAPPFHIGLMPLMYKAIRGSVLINHIQDLQVDAAKDLGMIKNNTFLKIMFGLERFILKRSTRVSTISDGMQRKIEVKGISPSQSMMIPNWVDEKFILPLSKEESLRKDFGIDNDTQVILYSGNLGEKQGLEVIIDVAISFKNDTNILFLICGSGGGKDRLVKLAEDAQLVNIRFLPLQPYEQLSALLATADIHLVLQKRSAADLVMPSKLTGILAAGGFAIVTALPQTTLYDVIFKHNIGLLIEPESTEALVLGIKESLQQDKQIAKKNARKYAEQYLSKQQIMYRFENDIKQLIVK